MHKLIAGLIIFTAVLTGIAPNIIPPNAQAAEMRESIAAIVNEDPITHREVDERLALVLSSAQLPDRNDVRERLRPQIVNQLIEEQLKIQDAKELKIAISDEDIRQGIEAVASSNQLEYEEFLSILSRQGVKLRTLRRQVEAQIAWSQVIARKIRPRVRIRPQDVEAELNRLKDSVGKQEFLLAEIYLPFNKDNTPEQVENFANNLISQMVHKNAPFQRLAQQFSQSAAAARGGDLGWIQQGQLPATLDEAAQSMAPGSLSPPLRTLSGFHILLLRNKRTIEEDNLPSEKEIERTLGLERIERQQRRLILDLRSAAFVDVRG